MSMPVPIDARTMGRYTGATSRRITVHAVTVATLPRTSDRLGRRTRTMEIDFCRRAGDTDGQGVVGSGFGDDVDRGGRGAHEATDRARRELPLHGDEEHVRPRQRPVDLRTTVGRLRSLPG